MKALCGLCVAGTAPFVVSAGRCKVLVRCGLLLAISLWCFARAVAMVHNQHRKPMSLDGSTRAEIFGMH